MADPGSLYEPTPAEWFWSGACAPGTGGVVAGQRARSGALLALHRRGVTRSSVGAGSHRPWHNSGPGSERTGNDQRAAFLAPASGNQSVIEPTGRDRRGVARPGSPVQLVAHLCCGSVLGNHRYDLVSSTNHIGNAQNPPGRETCLYGI